MKTERDCLRFITSNTQRKGIPYVPIVTGSEMTPALIMGEPKHLKACSAKAFFTSNDKIDHLTSSVGKRDSNRMESVIYYS